MTSAIAKPVLPPYVDYSPRVDDLMPEIQSPPSPLRLTNHTRPKSPNSIGEGSSPTRPSFRITDTQDLAEFLKTSSPNDFRKVLKGSSSDEQVFSLGSTYKKGIKFLRTSSSRPKLGSSGTSLPTVQAKTTSRGKPYLQIHVDYDNSIQAYGSTSGEETIISSCNQSERSSDSAPQDRAVVTNPTSSPRPSSAENRSCLSPDSWNTLGSTGAGSLSNYRLDNTPDGEVETKQRGKIFTKVTGGEGLKHQKNRARPPTTPPRSPTDCSPSDDVEMYLSSPSNLVPVKVQSRSSSLRRTKRSRTVSAQCSTNSVETTSLEKDDINALQRKKDRKTPPRPGPPPARSLPALPESRDITLGLISPTSRPRDSLISTSDSITSAKSGLNRSRQCSTDSGKSREDKVKARKAWDIQQARLRRQNPHEKPRSASAPGSGISSLLSHENRLPQSPSLEKVSSALARAPSDHNDHVASHQLDPVPGSITPPYSPVPHLDSMISPRTMSLSSTIASRMPCGSENYMSERELALESRLIAIERKNRMLEQTLIAVIRGSVSNGHRWSELQRTNALEDFLRELKTIDTGLLPPSTAFLGKPDNQCY